jgi:hypothetical protein
MVDVGHEDSLDCVARRWVCLKPLVHASHMAMLQQWPMEAAIARPGGRCSADVGEVVWPQKVCVE